MDDPGEKKKTRKQPNVCNTQINPDAKMAEPDAETTRQPYSHNWRSPDARNKEKWTMTSLRDKVTNPRTQIRAVSVTLYMKSWMEFPLMVA